jgi:UPF0716 protein FxsA
MLPRLLALFIIVPLLDLAILVRVGQWLGFWPTIGLVVATGTVGAILARSQGLAVLRGIRTEMSVGQIPSTRLLDGLLVLIGGTLLLTPGLLTDLAGFALLLPPSRRAVKRLLQRRVERMVRSGTTRFFLVRR